MFYSWILRSVATSGGVTYHSDDMICIYADIQISPQIPLIAYVGVCCIYKAVPRCIYSVQNTIDGMYVTISGY